MRLTRNSIALSGNFGKIDPRIHFDVFQITLTYVRAILKNVKIDLGLFFPNCPQSHAITSTNSMPGENTIFQETRKMFITTDTYSQEKTSEILLKNQRTNLRQNIMLK